VKGDLGLDIKGWLPQIAVAQNFGGGGLWQRKAGLGKVGHLFTAAIGYIVAL
jgi:hypothetical protein